ncbi:MAG: hypothetical protein WKF81_09780 [Thermomicrobiales bacterium]
MIRVVLPPHLKTLAQVDGEVQLTISGPVTQRSVVESLESSYPALRGTIRDQVSLKRRPLVRFFACEQDLTHQSPDDPLPEVIADGKEPYLIVGAMAGG